MSIKVIIVTYNSSKSISNCIEALSLASKNYLLYIIVVDNASTDNTLVVLDNLYPELPVIQLTENTGYAHANNIGLSEILAHDQNDTAILIINPDIILPPDSLDSLFALLTSGSEIGMVSPAVSKLENESPEAIFRRYRRFRSLWGIPMAKSFQGQVRIVEVDRLPGCCMLIKPIVLEKIGLFDEAYFLYWEELDLCLRTRRANFKLLINTDIVIKHNINEGERPHRIYYMYRNQFYFSIKNYGYLLGAAFLIRRLITLFCEIWHFLRLQRFDLLQTIWSGLVAGIKGEKGRSSNQHATPKISWN
ncbi:MAG: glycosyltransferase family 2 protein [Chloroflexi bacterium]|nr:glycosyltransferase family 2 protein [Chloroflexota bacterium]